MMMYSKMMTAVSFLFHLALHAGNFKRTDNLKLHEVTVTTKDAETGMLQLCKT